jgi:hypothetical protein
MLSLTVSRVNSRQSRAGRTRGHPPDPSRQARPCLTDTLMPARKKDRPRQLAPSVSISAPIAVIPLASAAMLGLTTEPACSYGRD